MADVARFLNLNSAARTVSPHPPSIDANKNDQMVGENDTKEVGEVGYKFRKQFGSMGWFTGTVVKIITKSYLRLCVYTEDGEFEDLRLVDLVELAKLDKKSTVSSKQSTEKVIKKNRASVINQAATSLSKKRKRAVAKSKHATLRKTNQFRTLLGKKTGKHVTGRCQCKDCEGKVKGNNNSTWVCSVCTRDGGVDPKQWWICGLEKRPECWLKHCRDMHSNSAARTVSPHPPSIDANKNDQMEGESDMKEVGEVGYKFRKQFGSMGWFTGTVVKKLPKPYYLRRCVYTEDGELEDLRLVDLVELAKLDKKSTVSSKQSIEKVIKKNRASVINQTATLSVKKRKRTISSSAPSREKSNILSSQREKIAREKLASYLAERGGMF
jgi:predicted DNA-binding protein (UPF0251 family)